MMFDIKDLGHSRPKGSGLWRDKFVVDALRGVEPPGLNRDELVEKIGWPRTTIYEVLQRLMESGIVVRTSVNRGPGLKGRPWAYFGLAEDAKESHGIH